MRMAISALAATVTVVLMAFPASAQHGAKALFYGQSGATVQPGAVARTPRPAAQLAGNYMGVRYWVELLNPDGRLSRVTADYRFRAGDRIKLYVQSNRDGYLTLVNAGSSGRSAVLFPSADMPSGTNTIRANMVYAIPPAGYMRFDSVAGEDTLILMLSATPIGGGPAPTDPMAASVPIGGPPVSSGAFPGSPSSAPFPQPAPAYPGPSPMPASPSATPYPPVPDPQASTSTFPQPGIPQPGAPPQPGMVGQGSTMSADDASRLVREALAKGAKDLVVETERTGPQPASYAVAPLNALQDGGMVTVQIKLRHQ